MPIREQSFRIGCGRYLQKPHLLKECGAEFARFGKKPFIIGGKTALSLTRDVIEKSVKDAGLEYNFTTHTGSCNDEDATALANAAKDGGFDVIVGVGGGVIMDFAKLTAFFADLPVVNVPTSSATCACFTPLSVRYTKEGRTVGSKHFEYEVDAVLADTAVLVDQPPRLFIAGVFDALAKYLEIKQRYNDDNYALGLDWAYVLSQRSFSELLKKTEIADNKAKLIAIGYDEKLAEETATAMIEKDLATVIKNQQAVMASIQKKAKGEAMASTPTPDAGKGTETITKAQFEGMTYAERNKLYTENPELYKTLSE